MKLHSLVSIGIVAILGAHPVFSQEAKNRAQVRAELDEAILSGNVLAPGEIGLPLNQQRPDRYPAAPREDGKSRNEVKSELTEALRTGDMVAGESSSRLNEVQPSAYPALVTAPGKSREQARSDLTQAIRSGDVLEGGELSAKRSERYPWSYRDKRRTLAGQGPHFNARRAMFSVSY